MKKLLGLLLLSTVVQAASITANYDQMFLLANAERNYLLNSGAEKNDAGVTDSSSIHSRSTSSPLIGVASHLIDGTGSSQNVDFSVTSLETGLLGTQCEGLFLLSGDASLYTATVRINSADVTTAQILPNTGSYSQPVSIVFPCGVSGVSPVLRITSTSASAAAIKLDTIYFGKAVSLGNVNQIGDWQSYTPTFTGFGTVSSSSFFWRKTGDSVEIIGRATVGTPTGVNAQITLPNSITIDSIKVPSQRIVGQWYRNLADTSTIEYVALATGGLSYFTVGRRTGSVAPLADAFGNAVSDTGGVVLVNLIAPISGWTTTSSYSLMNTYWKVDANISGANPSLGTSAVTSYTGIENGSLTLTNNSGTGNIAAQIGCSSTNAPSGTTCSAGSESVSVSFTPLGTFPQDILACASFAHEANLGTVANTSVASTFQIVETATNAQTVTQEGKGRIQSLIKNPTTATNNYVSTYPARVCGNFTFTSPGQKMLRLMYEQEVNNTPNTSQLNGDASATAGQRDIHWEVYPLSYNTPAPILVGGVTSGNTTGGERVERAVISGSSTIDSQSGSWLTSVTNNSTGDRTLNIASGVFSSAPTCVLAIIEAGTPSSGIDTNSKIFSVTTTALRLQSWFSNGATTTFFNYTLHVQCQGAR